MGQYIMFIVVITSISHLRLTWARQHPGRDLVGDLRKIPKKPHVNSFVSVECCNTCQAILDDAQVVFAEEILLKLLQVPVHTICPKFSTTIGATCCTGLPQCRVPRFQSFYVIPSHSYCCSSITMQVSSWMLVLVAKLPVIYQMVLVKTCYEASNKGLVTTRWPDGRSFPQTILCIRATFLHVKTITNVSLEVLRNSGYGEFERLHTPERSLETQNVWPTPVVFVLC